MEVISEGNIYEGFTIPDEAIVTKKPWNTIYEWIGKYYKKKQEVFPT